MFDLAPLPPVAPMGVTSRLDCPLEQRVIIRTRWIANSVDISVTDRGDGSDLVVHLIPRDHRPPVRLEVDSSTDFRSFLPALVAYLENCNG